MPSPSTSHMNSKRSWPGRAEQVEHQVGVDSDPPEVHRHRRLRLVRPRFARRGEVALGREHGDLADGADQGRLAGPERSGDDDLDGMTATAASQRPAGGSSIRHAYSPRTPAMRRSTRLLVTVGVKTAYRAGPARTARARLVTRPVRQLRPVRCRALRCLASWGGHTRRRPRCLPATWRHGSEPAPLAGHRHVGRHGQVYRRCRTGVGSRWAGPAGGGRPRRCHRSRSRR